MDRNSSPSGSDRLPAALACLAGFVMVAGGAFAAHGLEGTVPERDLAAFRTGMSYGLFHALAALVAVLAARHGNRFGIVASWIFLLGILLFSGSLSVLGLTGSRALVLVTPLGGLSFLVGWALLGIGFIRQESH